MNPQTTSRQLHGGLIFQHKSAPLIESLPLPATICIPLIQHQGHAGRTLVATGETVFNGQALTASDDYMRVPVHASANGVVTNITDSTITIATNTTPFNHAKDSGPPDYSNWSRAQFIQHFHQAGLVGLGGAGYPVAAKLNSLAGAARVLLINAAECDPYICCDDALISQRTDDVVRGIAIAISATDATRCIVAIEDNKPHSIRRLKDSLKKNKLNHVEVVYIPSVYPGGAESLLFTLAVDDKQTGTATQLAGFPSESGMISFNIATCYSMYQSVYLDLPLRSRLTTVIDLNSTARNFELPIGTPLADLLDATSTNPNNILNIRSGGYMMGVTIAGTATIDKSSNCISLHSNEATPLARECIRCGACAEVCPVQLLPQQLYAHSRALQEDQLQQLNIDRCIECASCDAVCPSNIPLTRIFKSTKNSLKLRLHASIDAELAKQRFEKRERRLKQQVSNQSRKLARKQDSLAVKDTKTFDPRRRLVEEALLRAQRKKKFGNNASPQTPRTGDKS